MRGIVPSPPRASAIHRLGELLIAGRPGTSRWCGCRHPGRARGCAPGRRSAGTGGRPCRRSRRNTSWRPCSADSCINGRTPCTTASASSSLTSAVRRQGSMPARQHASDFQKLPMPATTCWSRSTSPSAREGSSSRNRRRNRASSNGRAATRSGPSDARRGSPRTLAAVSSSSTGPLNWTTSTSPRRSTSHAARVDRGQRSPRRITHHAPVMRRCEWTRRPPSKRRSRCLPTASTASTCRPARRCGHRSWPKRGGGVAISSGT